MKCIRSVVLLCATLSMASCSAYYYKPPSLYWTGQGFYAETLTVEQLRDAEADGKVRDMGRFFSSAFGCFGYTERLVEKNIIVPAIQEGLHEKLAIVARNVKVIPPFEAHILSLPFAAFGCASWSVEGEALGVNPS